jgi:Zeta toxin
LTVSVDAVLLAMAERGLIPVVEGLSPLEAADLAHAEAQFIGKRLALRALADGRNVIFDISQASRPSVQSWYAAPLRAGYTVTWVFTKIDAEESVRHSGTAHRRGQEAYRADRGYGGRYIPPEAIRALAHTAPASPLPPGGTGGNGGQEASASSEVADLITAYASGQRSLREIVEVFRELRWPPVPPVCPPSLAAAGPAVDDLEPYVPGSFDDVVLAYDLGQITDSDYKAFASAAAGRPGAG